MTSGIYKIINKVNGKIYIGSAVCIVNRKRIHWFALRHNKHHSSTLQNAWNKYGENSFIFETIEEVQEKGKLIEREQFYLDALSPEYNICKIAGSCLGQKHSEEARQKMSEAHKGEKHHFFGKNHSKEAKQKMSESKKGKHRSEETRQKMSDALKGEKHHNFGKHLSEETRQKISESQKGKHRSEETRQKISEPSKGEKNGHYGKHHSEESRQKMSEARKGEKSSSAKLTWEKVNEIREKYKTGKFSYAKLAKEYEVSPSAIQYIIENRTWIMEK